MVRRSVLDQIYREMISIRVRLDDIENNFSKFNLAPLPMTESNLISLPDHLRKTYMIVLSKGKCDAVQVSNLTGRCRAVESNYLNQLSRMGWLDKHRISKVVYFQSSHTPNSPLQPVKTKPELITTHNT
ncbi:hypothetical protein [Candidatus Bathycorpusculum sp.]|jgi:hypothetical protein|uniref:hypothetical protein n=1 Tax=Candidatus Bathycorpusculum sp. TaxID=2994959 RepID=UPI0028283EA8|nr:hypothetical protein [Candidatus Termitimicrobium sp.]MCL2686346.1 hypothetical protein [Candidatus Termitimicrobium sp.]